VRPNDPRRGLIYEISLTASLKPSASPDNNDVVALLLAPRDARLLVVARLLHAAGAIVVADLLCLLLARCAHERQSHLSTKIVSRR
jgi:hypothetical protein